MRIGIFGGTFDPPHIAHTLACLYCLETSAIERILVIPCFQHPFGKETCDFRHRLEMTRIGMKRLEPAVEVLDLEAKLPPPSFTIDTIREIKRLYPEAALQLIVGSDNIKDFPKWKEHKSIAQIAPLLILPRLSDLEEDKYSGEDLEGIYNYDISKDRNFKPFLLPPVSSTQIRQRIRNNLPVRGLLSSSVMAYIHDNNLYTTH